MGRGRVREGRRDGGDGARAVAAVQADGGRLGFIRLSFLPYLEVPFS